MHTAHGRLAVRSSKRHPLRLVLIVAAVIAITAAYLNSPQGISGGIDLSWITDAIFG